MIINDPARSYGRPVTGGIHVGQRPARRDAWELPGGVVLWKAVGKLALGFFACALVVRIGMGFYLNSLEQATLSAENVRHELMDTNISLLAKRASLLAPEHMDRVAGRLLSLDRPGEGQVLIYSRAKGRFVRP